MVEVVNAKFIVQQSNEVQENLIWKMRIATIRLLLSVFCSFHTNHGSLLKGIDNKAVRTLWFRRLQPFFLHRDLRVNVIFSIYGQHHL